MSSRSSQFDTTHHPVRRGSRWKELHPLVHKVIHTLTSAASSHVRQLVVVGKVSAVTSVEVAIVTHNVHRQVIGIGQQNSVKQQERPGVLTNALISDGPLERT